ncbi:LysR family transcriptional regulator [Ottowia thiooxydans]|uniref:DNA-binding transcriptional LysR family regulator n=1 Tax=Ottowia thiooxydans TaxID=219182 RepID=A0ABV2QF69_9BURK
MPKTLNNRVLQESALRHFLAVVRHGSVSEAANRLGVAPSAVSRHIARLESELDTLLFERRARGMVPNAAGELLAVHAKRAWQEIERVADDIKGLRGLRMGTVRIASTEGFANEFIPPLAAEFRRSYSGISFSLKVSTQARIVQMVREGEIDIGISLGLSSERGINVEFRHPSPILAVVGKGHPLAKKRELSLAQVAAYPVALPHHFTTLRQLLDISVSRQGLHFETVFACDHLGPLIRFAASGGGVTFCGMEALKGLLESKDVVAIALRDREMNERHFEVQTMAGRTLPAACKAFLDHIGLVLGARLPASVSRKARQG